MSENGGDAGVATGSLTALVVQILHMLAVILFLADDDLNPFISSRTARIRHP